MLFNSYAFIFVFFPVVAAFYFTIKAAERNASSKFSHWWLVAASLFFYGFWDYRYLVLIIASILGNYIAGKFLRNQDNKFRQRSVLVIGIATNLLLLGYFKYANFFLENVGILLGSEISIGEIALPLAISFFTFQQIAFLIDSASGKRGDCHFSDYCLFVSFFPQLIAGPIVHHGEMMPQFERSHEGVNWDLMAKGLFVFCLGLFKKVTLADSLATWVSPGFAAPENLTFIDSWLVTMSYSLQLYFDFSGYSDMAIGSAMMLGIVLPWNFKSPYKALTIQEFWRRWHITLSRFLRDYLYIPLGGSRAGESRIAFNLFLTFLLGGIWHGAGWTFVIWGTLHGIACVTHRMWSRRGFSLGKIPAAIVMLFFLNITWIFFRAPDVASAIEMVKAILGFNGLVVPDQIASVLPWLPVGELLDGFTKSSDCPLWVLAGGLVVLFAPSSFELSERFRPSVASAIFTLVLFIVSFFHLNRVSEFLYFQF